MLYAILYISGLLTGFAVALLVRMKPKTVTVKTPEQNHKHLTKKQAEKKGYASIMNLKPNMTPAELDLEGKRMLDEENRHSAIPKDQYTAKIFNDREAVAKILDDKLPPIKGVSEKQINFARGLRAEASKHVTLEFLKTCPTEAQWWINQRNDIRQLDQPVPIDYSKDYATPPITEPPKGNPFASFYKSKKGE